jgi:deazaflavin-dependent oxidoreductase (nitroreductase family)
VGKSYQMTLLRKLGNWFITLLRRLGIPLGPTCLLTVTGRRTGMPRSTPVRLVGESGHRWIVAPYGEVNWVRNARAAGKATLTCGRRAETLPIEELGPREAAPILKRYVTDVPITRPYFDVTPAASVEAFAMEASRHPVFRVRDPAPRES